MKTQSISLIAVACLALGTTACSSSGGGSDNSGGSHTGGTATTSATGTTGDISKGVTADPAAVKLLPASAKSNGTISVALDMNTVPTSFYSASNKPEGFNVDISRLIAAKLGLKLVIKDVSFTTIIPGLTGGRYDFTATDMSASSERLKQLDMINYWKDGSSLLEKSGNPKKLDINTTSICGSSIAVQTGSTQQQTYLPELSKKCAAAGKPAVKTVVLPNVNTALTQVSSGRADGFFYDTPTLAYAVQQHGAAFTLTTSQYAKPARLGTDLVAIGLSKHSPLTKAVQVAMQSVIDGPLYKKALENWGMGAGAIKTASIATPPAS